MECRWCQVHYMQGLALPQPEPEPPPVPSPNAHSACRASDPALCPVCYARFLNREHLKRHLMRQYGISDREPMIQHLTVTLHADPPGGYYRCPLCPYYTADLGLFARRHMFMHGPLPLDTPSPVKNIRIEERVACPHCSERFATSQLARHIQVHMRRQEVSHAPSPPSASSTPADAPQQLPSTGPKIQHCPRCEHALSTIPGIIYHVQNHHPDVTRLQVLEGENKKKWIPRRPRIHTCPDCCRAFITPNGLLRHRVVKHGLRAPRPLEMSIRLTCEETPGHLLVCPGLQALREKHDMETPHGVEAVADVKLANFLLEMDRHIPHSCSPMSSESRPGVAANGTDNAISQVPSADSSLIDASSEGVSNRRRRRDGADEVPPPRSRIVQYRGGRFAVKD